jgi:hypothetical protein
MKNFVCCILFVISVLEAFTQKVYFIYLQSEPSQPFLVKLHEKTYHSNISGYLILSQLKDSTYRISIDFPGNKSGEQVFLVNIKSKDRGFLLKNFAEKGWGLFDLQTMSVLMSTESKGSGKTGKTQQHTVSAFTEILSRAANDPSLRERPVFAVNKVIEVSTPEVVAKEDAAVSNEQLGTIAKAMIPVAGNETSVPVGGTKEQDTTQSAYQAGSRIGKEEPAMVRTVSESQDSSILLVEKESPPVSNQEIKTIPPDEYKRSLVIKKAESATTGGFGLTFIDQFANGGKDTIQITIPDAAPAAINTGNREREDKNKFLDITSETKETRVQPAKNVNNCSSTASENDFIRLRKRMASQLTEEAMINEAKRGLKVKCFATEQIKHLGSLFRNEPARFQFFEVAYPYSKDKENFGVLQAELKENYFIYRFKNLVKLQ